MPRTIARCNGLSSPQRLEHMPDTGAFDVAEREDLDVARRGHQIGDAELIALGMPLDRRLEAAFAEDVGRSQDAEHRLAIVHHEQQPHAARDHELVCPANRRLRTNGRRARAGQIGHRVERRRLEIDARRLRLGRPPETGAVAQLTNR